MLNKIFTGLLVLLLPFSVIAGSKDEQDENQRKRYSFGAIPALAFDSDLGFKYGGVINFFDFGTKGVPPHFEQYLMLKATNTTKGTLNAQALLESESIINKAKVFAEASYLVDQKLDFFGFNGTQSVYHSAFTEQGHEAYISEAFYAHRRKLLRLRFDLQKYLGGSRFRLLTGFTYNRFLIEPAAYQEDDSAQKTSLFEKYREWGLINERERDGGTVGIFSLGLVFDSRNDPCYCTDGKWFESVLQIAPGLFSKNTFSQFILTYRQHSSFLNDNLTLSFRLSSQQKLSGEIPFYYLPTFYDSRLTQDGVGGAFNLRGAMRNRIAADGFVTGNFEIKMKTLDFNLLSHHIYTSLSFFYDNALVTQSRKVNLENVPASQKENHFTATNQRMHHTFGAGLYIVFNRNNVITINYGIPENEQLGSGSLYVGSSLLF